MTLIDDFGALMLQARRLAGLQQNDLAERLKIRQSYISRVETGRTNPTLATVEQFAEAIGFLPLLVLLPQGPPAAEDPDPELLNAMITSLRTAVARLLDALAAIEPQDAVRAASEILDQALAQNRRAGDRPSDIPAVLKRRICQYFAPHLKDMDSA